MCEIKRTYEKWTSELSEKLTCKQCHWPLESPVQYECCGVRTCGECTPQTNGASCICPSCNNSNSNAKLDRGFLNEHKNRPINCPECGDSWVGLLKDLKAHLKSHWTVECKNCDEKFVTMEQLKAHQLQKCRIRVSPCPLCSFGCSDEVPFSELGKHLVHSKHQQCLLFAVRSVWRKEETSSALSLIRAQTQQLMIECLPKINSALEQSELTNNEYMQLQLRKESIEMKLKTMCEQLQECNKGITKFQELVLSIRKMMEEMEQDIDKMKKNSVTGPQVLDAEDTFTWKIYLVLLLNDKSLKMNSNTFQTSECGYRMGISMTTEIDQQSGEHFISISVTIFAGDFDGILQWPFPYPITLILMDISGGQKHIGRRIEPYVKNAIFDKPTEATNKPFTISQFYPTQKLLENAHSYIQDDHSYLKVHVDFTAKNILTN